MCHKSGLIVSPGTRATYTAVILRAALLRDVWKDGRTRPWLSFEARRYAASLEG
jgi:hypothetical protein